MKKVVFSLVLTAFLLAGAACWLFQARGASPTEQIFTYASVERGPIVEAVSATGVLHPKDTLLITCELPGTVVAVFHNANDIVEEGELLLKLDDRRARIKVEQAENAVRIARQGVSLAQVSMQTAQLGLKRQSELGDKGFQSDRDVAQSRVKESEAGLKLSQDKVHQAELAEKEAKLGLALTEVRVPIDPSNIGKSAARRAYLIMERKVQLGQEVGPQAPASLFTLAANLEQMEAHAQVAEGDISRVRPDQPATFTVSTYSEEEISFRGKVKQIRVMPATVQGAVFYTAVIEVANQRDPATGDWRLLPGMTASVDIVSRERKHAWKVPTAALSFEMEEGYQTPEAKAALAEWRGRPDRDAWRPVWTWQAGRNRVWPVFVRIGGLKGDDAGLKDDQFNEVLEWEPKHEPGVNRPELRVITNAPPFHKPGLFDQPANLKLS